MQDEHPAEHTVPSCPVTRCPHRVGQMLTASPSTCKGSLQLPGEIRAAQRLIQMNINHTLGCQRGYMWFDRLQREGEAHPVNIRALQVNIKAEANLIGECFQPASSLFSELLTKTHGTLEASSDTATQMSLRSDGTAVISAEWPLWTLCNRT